ncbi:MAG: alpha/beta hydrolase fold domain-containing protein [Burkholderiales bacterium]|nr:alpha/beta hydrolase fold domain-containing protein [Burkholderiales bacterium]
MAMAFCGLCSTAVSAQADRVTADADGTVHVPARQVPLSNYLSPEARDFMIRRLTTPIPPAAADIVQARASVETTLAPLVSAAQERYPARVLRTTLGGVPVLDVSPRAGISKRNAHRVLIELHGGAFAICETACAMVESLPAAVIGGIRVVAVSYRQGPEHKFPAASEDVAAVYRALLAHYRPQNIGIFGCSAGGMLAAESLAWFQTHGLPRPGAAGILCASVVDFGGDAPFVGWPLDDGTLLPPPSEGDRIGRRGELPPFPYFEGAEARDPLVQPGHFPEVLARFPPTLVATGSRGFDASSAYETHRRLWRAGVPTELHVWDGLPHGFHSDTSLPESRELIQVMLRFFDAQLGRRARQNITGESLKRGGE